MWTILNVSQWHNDFNKHKDLYSFLWPEECDLTYHNNLEIIVTSEWRDKQAINDTRLF